MTHSYDRGVSGRGWRRAGTRAPLGSTHGAAMRPFVAPGASDGLPLLLLDGLGAVLPPLPPLPPDQRLLPPHPPTQIADIWSRSESQPVAPVPAPTPAPKRVCHMCGAEKRCKYKLSDQLIKTFSAALANGSAGLCARTVRAARRTSVPVVLRRDARYARSLRCALAGPSTTSIVRDGLGDQKA